MAKDALTAAVPQKKIYRDNQSRMIFVVLISILANFVLASMLAYIITHPTEPKYFATTVNGRTIPLKASDLPTQSDPFILEWASIAATSAYTYNFVNYNKALLASSKFFTPEGWAQFLSQLDASNTLNAVMAKKLIVSAVTIGKPTLTKKGFLNGVYAWGVQMQILVAYQSASEIPQQNYVVKMLIVRIPTRITPMGIGISQFIVLPASGEVS